jgi:uncharacterized protein (TIRG00374 family)
MVAAATLAALTPIAASAAVVSASLPTGLKAFAWIGAVVAALVVLAGFALLRGRLSMEILVAVAGLADRVMLRRLDRPLDLDLDTALRRRSELRDVLADRWRLGVGAAVTHWLCEVAALGAALAAAGAVLTPSLLLLAYAAAAVLRLMPITPGGLGFVEAGLVGTLVAAGVAAPQAVLGTLVYRLVTYWLALPVGLVAYAAFRRRYPLARGPHGRARPR